MADSSPLIPASWLQGVIDAHTNAEAELIAEMAKRLSKGLGSDDWARLRAGDTAAFKRRVNAVLGTLAADTEPAVIDALTRAYGRGHGSVAPAPERLTRRVLGSLRAAHAGARTSANRAWNNAVAVGRAAPDEASRRRGVQRILDRLAGKGLTAARDHNRNMSLRPLVEQVLGDAAHEAGRLGFFARLRSRGSDLVIVTRSPHPCPVCEPWEEIVLSVGGKARGIPSMATARDAGLFHPRCRHTVFAWQPGFVWPPNSIERQPGTYEAEQRQRTIERHIRSWKLRQAAAMDDLTKAQAGRKVRQWQAALRQHLATEGLTRSRQRERTDFGHSRPLTHAHGA
ncbi:phage minor capsid protein [Streptomyces sp.]|uniref:phage minor capsid protein n=1 Tax=Streptomyces sp. TaxID=1931 RepID=UPI002F954977